MNPTSHAAIAAAQPFLPSDVVGVVFLDTRQHDADKLRAAHARGDDEAMAHLAHTTISTAGTIGAARLSEIAGHLQEGVRVGAAGELPTLIEAFARSHRHVVDELAAFVATH